MNPELIDTNLSCLCRTLWIFCGFLRETPVRLVYGSSLHKINRTRLSHCHLSPTMRSSGRQLLLWPQFPKMLWPLSVLYISNGTLWIDGASKVKVEEVEGHFDFHDFLLADVLGHPWFNIKNFFWHSFERYITNRHSLNLTLRFVS